MRKRGSASWKDIKLHYNMVVPTQGVSIIYRDGMEEALGVKYYSELYLMDNPGKKKE